jgi:hypothetical protein
MEAKGGVLLFLAKLKIENAKKMIFWGGFCNSQKLEFQSNNETKAQDLCIRFQQEANNIEGCLKVFTFISLSAL